MLPKGCFLEITPVLGILFQCSTSCGFGYQQRITYCVGIHSVQDLHAHGLQTVAYRECPVEPSPYIYKCNVKECSQAATWRVGKWTKVSTDVQADFFHSCLKHKWLPRLICWCNFVDDLLPSELTLDGYPCLVLSVLWSRGKGENCRMYDWKRLIQWPVPATFKTRRQKDLPWGRM